MGATLKAAPRLNLRLELASQAEDVPLARELLSGAAEAVGVDLETMDDIRTAVTEACNNVVQHAYDGIPGPIELDLSFLTDVLEVTVRDRGAGMRPWIRTHEADTLGIGLMIIKALAESVEFRDAPEGGLEVQMRFATPGLPMLDSGGPVPEPPEPPASASSSIAISIGPVSLASAVLSRLLGAMAARAHFSTDRISDLHLVGDAIAAHAAPVVDGEHLCVRIAASPRTVILSLSPLLRGGSERLLAEASIQSVGGVIERLTDEREVHDDDAEETFVITMRDHR